MDIKNLVKMANKIGDFFEGEPDREMGINEVYSHLTRFWAPQMRQQIIAHVQNHPQSHGLTDITLKAINQVDVSMALKQA